MFTPIPVNSDTINHPYLRFIKNLAASDFLNNAQFRNMSFATHQQLKQNILRSYQYDAQDNGKIDGSTLLSRYPIDSDVYQSYMGMVVLDYEDNGELDASFTDTFRIQRSLEDARFGAQNLNDVFQAASIDGSFNPRDFAQYVLASAIGFAQGVAISDAGLSDLPQGFESKGYPLTLQNLLRQMTHIDEETWIIRQYGGSLPPRVQGDALRNLNLKKVATGFLVNNFTRIASADGDARTISGRDVNALQRESVFTAA